MVGDRSRARSGLSNASRQCLDRERGGTLANGSIQQMPQRGIRIHRLHEASEQAAILWRSATARQLCVGQHVWRELGGHGTTNVVRFQTVLREEGASEA